MLTSEDQTYLTNKHRGGINNLKGNSYENLYAIYKIALLLKQYPENYEEISLSSQIEGAFVDDLLISHFNGRLNFYQLKNTHNLTWGSGSSHTLEYDFRKQKELLEEQETSFSLFLIYSDGNSNVTTIPGSVSDCTQVKYFPYFSDLNRLLMESDEFKKAIKDISADQSPQITQLIDLATILLGVWDSLNQNKVSLAIITQRIKDLPLMGNNFIFDEPLQINEEVKEILEDISNFKFMAIGNTFHWSYKERLTGKILKTSFQNFEKNVLENKPTEFFELKSCM